MCWGSMNTDPSIVYSSTSDQPIANSKPPSEASLKIPPCRDSVHCLNQESKDRIGKYSHPCRFNELCRNKHSEPHLVHECHNIYKCSDSENVSNEQILCVVHNIVART
ncbi:unnamed protein product [Rotaria magnacalcarata]|uniref:Uncharacterized protein n=1 Tax=Rotaria magnacalcarata TaxID=392030 RepID=A0A819XEE2_9BILA|nr:unnamed protein product [Rotaria magnacalcarata]CAF2133531.1 unnamed protein product [Rotaria magnacalcarata]CAF4075132.1 unnamed protein product [Rotaria magnacalcarata]CAF4139045.1 unnamed protein product [Rotaria magnacalcarata]